MGMAGLAAGLTIVVFGTVCASTTPAQADCASDLAEINTRLAAPGIDPAMQPILRSFRDQGAAQCDIGNEAAASNLFTSVFAVLDSLSPAPPAQATPPNRMQSEHTLSIETMETVYLNDAGEGILRYTIADSPPGAAYGFSTGALTGDLARPIAHLGGGFGPYAGPDIDIFLWGLTEHTGVPLDLYVLSLFQRDANRTVTHFRFVIDNALAEPRANCGEINPQTMECATKRR
jgi:hypothetical protein